MKSLATTTLLLLSLLSQSFAEAPAASTEKNLDAIVKEVQAPAAADELLDKVQSTGQKFEFQSDVTRLLKIFADHMYVSDEAFLRELISNSCDAIRKQRTAKMRAALDGLDANAEEDDDYKIVIKADKEQGIITVTDNGVGMTQNELKDFLGTIAKSGTSKFNLDSPSKNAEVSNFIGQFGVGFYSVLLVADKVMVISKNDADSKQWIWETDSSASYRLAEDPRGNTLKRGTQIVLKLKPKANRFLDDSELEKVLRKYFEYDSNAIYLVNHTEEEVPLTEEEVAKESEEKKEGDEPKKDVELDEPEELKEGEEAKKDEKPKTKKVPVEKAMLVSQHQQPIWKREAADLKPADYNDFYKVLTKEKSDPLTYIHVKAEGDLDFRSILYIPKKAPFNAFSVQKNSESFIKLHVRGVFITAKLDDFLPKYLNFVKGVIDSDDLPLNVSRDMLQSNDGLRSVQKKIVSKIFEMIENLAKDDGKYKEFFSSYGSHLKLEVIENEQYRTKIAKLLRYETSTSSGKLVGLKEYIERAEANEKQAKKKVIYFLAGSSKSQLEKSPYLEKLKSAGIEVLYLLDTVDEHTLQALREFDDWKFQSIAKEGLDIDDEDEATRKATEEEYKPLTEFMGKSLKSQVEKVIISSRLTESPCAVVASQFGWTGSMERVIMSQSNSKDDPMLSFFAGQKKIFEINPKNEIIKKLLEKAKNQTEEKPDAALRVATKSLFNAYKVLAGYSVDKPEAFARDIHNLSLLALGLPLQEEPAEDEKADDNPFANFGNLSMSEGETAEVPEEKTEAAVDASAPSASDAETPASAADSSREKSDL